MRSLFKILKSKMSTSLIFFVALGLVQAAYSQVLGLGNGIGCNNGIGPNGYIGGPNGFIPNLAPNGVLGPNFIPGNGLGSLPVGSVGSTGYGDVAVAGELPVGGTTAVAGQVPVIGYVTFEGIIPAGGLVSIASNGCGCNNGVY